MPVHGRMSMRQAILLADLLSAAGRKAPVLWLRSPDHVMYGIIMAVNGPPDADVRDCYAQVEITGTRQLQIASLNPPQWAGDRRVHYDHTSLLVSEVIADMGEGLFVIDPTPDKPEDEDEDEDVPAKSGEQLDEEYARRTYHEAHPEIPQD